MKNNSLHASSMECIPSIVEQDENPSLQQSDQDDPKDKDWAILSKIDRHIVPWICVIYICSIIERTNIGIARLVHLESDLKMTPDEFNWAITIFYFGYILLEVPSNLMLQKFTPRIWLSRIAISWGITACAMAFVQNVIGLLITRFVLGIMEAGLVPGILYYQSFWYKKHELALRMGLFFSSAQLAGGLGGLISFGISHLDGISFSGWRWIFFLEGIPSILLGCLLPWVLPNSPQQAKFLTLEEKIHVEYRLLLDNIRCIEDKIFWKDVWMTLADLKIWCYSFIFIGLVTPAAGLAVFLATIIHSWGFEALDAQLFAAPPPLIAAICIICISYSSDRFKDRYWHLLCCTLLSAICLFVMPFLRNVWLLYCVLTLAIIGAASSIPLCMSWASNNLLRSTRRAVGLSFIVTFGNLGAAISGQIYRQDEAPFYPRGHFIMSMCCLWVMLWSTILYIAFRKENQKRDKCIVLQTEDESWEVDDEITMEDDKRFRYQL